MVGPEHGQLRRGATRDDGPVPLDASQASTVRADALDADLDDVLDEIDAVLESNAEEFVAGFVQKGGE